MDFPFIKLLDKELFQTPRPSATASVPGRKLFSAS